MFALRSALPRRSFPSTLALALALLLCAPGCKEEGTFVDAGPPDLAPTDLPTPVDIYINPCAPNAPPTVTGTIYAPNGVDPVAGASIGVPLALAALPPQVRCDTCAVAGKFSAQTYAKADGTFRLEGVPNDGKPFKLAIQKGYFRRVIDVTVPSCGSVELTKEQTRLPGKTKEYGEYDTIPKIAVVSGAWDQLEKVLTKLGVQEKVIFNGRDLGSGPESMQALLQNGAVLKSHHMVFINCGNKFEALVTEPGPARNNLRDYVKAGGRLFVTDYSYDFVEQAFPEFIDFQGGHDGEPLTKQEPHNAAEVGKEDLVVEGDVLDADLKKWLALPAIGALLPNGLVQIVGFQTAWAVQKEVNPLAKVWVTGRVYGIGVTPDVPRPLTSSWDFVDADKQGCGRLVFSSYHTHGTDAALLPQERVLEYLVLEIGGCPRVQ